MKHNSFILAVLAAACLAACSNDSEDETSPTAPVTPVERKLVVRAAAAPWASQGGLVRATRAGVITTQSLTSFTMHYQQDTYSVSRSDGNSEWSTAPQTWPSAVDNDTPVSFYAHTAGTYYYKGGYAYVSFTAEELASNTHDLLVARKEDVTYSATKGVVWFTFDHACAAVDFNIKITEALRQQRSGNLTVNKVELRHIAKQDDYHFAGGWQSVGTAYTDYTLNTADMEVTTALQALPCSTMFFIPQAFSDDETKLVVTYDTNKTAEISLKGIEWKAGYQYPVDIVLGTKLIK